MIHIILKQDLEQNKLDALVAFLESMDIEVELKKKASKKVLQKNDFSLAVGLWKDRPVNASELRINAWSRNK